ncbi:MAG: hypothetical protein F4Y68_03540 [Boseongicola sp. SB0665_bin_10]|nr:hypothetical protein [Boseongicola sp. SB0665_bin_10]
MKFITTAEVLEAYSQGAIGSADAIRRIGGTGFRDLLIAMANCDFPLPRGAGRESEVEREIAEALPILREHLNPVWDRAQP